MPHDKVKRFVNGKALFIFDTLKFAAVVVANTDDKAREYIAKALQVELIQYAEPKVMKELGPAWIGEGIVYLWQKGDAHVNWSIRKEGIRKDNDSRVLSTE